MSKGRMPAGAPKSGGGHAKTNARPGGVPGRSGMPNTKVVSGKSVTAAPAPSRGQTARSSQGGSTSPATDGGGGVGNTAADLNRMLGK